MGKQFRYPRVLSLMEHLPIEILERILPLTASATCKLFTEVAKGFALHKLNLNPDNFTSFIDGLFIKKLTPLHKFLLSCYTDYIISKAMEDSSLWRLLISKNKLWVTYQCFERSYIDILKTYCISDGIWSISNVMMRYTDVPLEKFKTMFNRFTEVIIGVSLDTISDAIYDIVLNLFRLGKYTHAEYCLGKNLINVTDIDHLLSYVHNYSPNERSACMSVLDKHIDTNDIPRFQCGDSIPGLILRANEDPDLWIKYLDHLFHDDSLMKYDAERIWERPNRSPQNMDSFIEQCIDSGHYDTLIYGFMETALDQYLPPYIPYCQILFRNIIEFNSYKLNNFILDVLITYGREHNPRDRDMKNVYNGIPKLAVSVRKQLEYINYNMEDHLDAAVYHRCNTAAKIIMDLIAEDNANMHW